MSPPPAFAYGQAVRVRRAKEKCRVAAMPYTDGRTELADMIEDDLPVWLEGEPIGRFLRWANHMGRLKMIRLLRNAGFNNVPVNELRRLTELTDRERLALAQGLRGER